MWRMAEVERWAASMGRMAATEGALVNKRRDMAMDGGES